MVNNNNLNNEKIKKGNIFLDVDLSNFTINTKNGVYSKVMDFFISNDAINKMASLETIRKEIREVSEYLKTHPIDNSENSLKRYFQKMNPKYNYKLILLKDKNNKYFIGCFEK